MSDASETVALANKVIDLLAKGADQVGQTASQAFPLVVRYQWAQAVTGVGLGLVFLSVAVACGFGFRRSLNKKAALNDAGKYGGDGEVLVAWLFAVGVTALCAFAFLGTNIPVVIEPTGATIDHLLKTVR